jgi:hypothetical protein
MLPMPCCIMEVTMRRASLILVPFILIACTAQLNAHEQSIPRRVDPDKFEPVIIKEPTIIPPIIDTLAQASEPFKPRIKQPVAKKQSVPKVAKVRKVPTAVANSNPKEYALSVVGQEQFNCLEPLWDRESHWNYKSLNHSSGAYGIPQAVPGSKMASAGADWKTNPITQVDWGIHYVNGRYGSSCGAWNFWRSHHWY